MSGKCAEMQSTGGGQGALTELVARGALDGYLTEDPEVTYWKAGFTKCAPFAVESIVQQFSTNPQFGGNGQCTIQRSGDLVYHMYLAVDLPGVSLCKVADGMPACPLSSTRKPVCKMCPENVANSEWRSSNYGSCDNACDSDGVAVTRTTRDDALDNCAWVHWANAVGQLMIDEASIAIGQQTITSIWGELMFCMEELSGRVGRRLLEMVGKRYTRHELIVDSQEARTLFVPLPFWFTLASGAALPLVSMSFHSVVLTISFRKLDDLLVINVPCNENGEQIEQMEVLNCCTNARIAATDLKAHIMSTYVYLENAERTSFANADFSSLIVQHQRHPFNSRGKSSFSERLNFNHPIIELIWFARRVCHETNGAFFNFAGIESRDPIIDCSLMLNHQPRFQKLPASYYRLVQPYQAHSCIPDTFVYCYSFALHPEDTCTPSGSANFSRIDNIAFGLTLQEGLADESVTINIYATNWNILQFKGGMAGLMYAN